jgi:hypothetical protein
MGKISGLVTDFSCVSNAIFFTGPDAKADAKVVQPHGLIVGQAHATYVWGERGRETSPLARHLVQASSIDG